MLARCGQPDYRLNRLFFKQQQQDTDANKPPQNSQCHYFDVKSSCKANCHPFAAGSDSSGPSYRMPRHFFEWAWAKSPDF
ncbi:hypothetical protein [Pseudomonas sp. RGM 3321]|uniref:hypothetical protein n=1 Tax=Pseudomonas sp. RGM 3321 TaxID=2930089 RepID=UPI001FCB440F|nr:hypothetical protein [Pseudomonas sp. RGM 3321]MCJ2373572.1 hypothetical protein [Pseudomonas sp. RGM 3321]